jgi:DNA-binding MarR family transcriptional regulator
MANRILVEKRRGNAYATNIEIVDNPKKLSPVTTKVGWQILKKINENPMYPKEISKALGINEQNVYYYIRKLKKEGIIAVVKEEEKHGALCKYFSPTSKAFGIELPSKKERMAVETKRDKEKIKDFFYEFTKTGIFNGSIVVGSPQEHGPYLTAARDGHYAIQLSLFLGEYCDAPNKFIVKLDTELKVEKKKGRNLMVIGGPVTNIIASDLNSLLKIRFVWDKKWKLYSTLTKKTYVSENIGLISKIKNPWDSTKEIILISGLQFAGTKACIIALTQHYQKILKNYQKNKDFYVVIKGLDKDGDGKIDTIKVLE